jgi:sulfide:quinone oxidoreductase
MAAIPVPSSPLRVLIAGGGIAGMEAALALRHAAGERVVIELLTPGADLVDRPGSVRVPFADVDVPRLPLASVAASAGIVVRRGSLAAVDVTGHRARTRDGTTLDYDRLVVAVGAHAAESVPGAMHFRGPPSVGTLEATVRAVAETPEATITFALASAVTWPLPIYELALLAAADLAARGITEPRTSIVTHEDRPLELLGPAASHAMSRLLGRAGIGVTTSCDPRAAFDGTLQLATGALMNTGRVVALPALEGHRLDGLPYTGGGFLAVDPDGRVQGAADVFAVGDAADWPVKQGGLGAQQADAAATQIAFEAGAAVHTALPARVLRAVLTTPDLPLYTRMPLDGCRRTAISRVPLWHPPAKVAARFLAGFMTGEAGTELTDVQAAVPDTVVAAT